MTRYFTQVSNDLLVELLAGSCEPAGLRVVREVRRDPQWTVVEFEDDGAPPEMEGQHISPSVSRGDDGRIWVSERYVNSRPA